jgi:hypothetical protein
LRSISLIAIKQPNGVFARKLPTRAVAAKHRVMSVYIVGRTVIRVLTTTGTFTPY